MNLGNSLKLTFTNKVGDALADADTVSVIVKDPANTETTYTYPTATFTRAAVGTYQLLFSTSESGVAGLWKARIKTSTGGVPSGKVVSFRLDDPWS